MSMTRRVRAVLRELEMLSEGRVQSWNSDRTHGGDPDYTPKGHSSAHDEWKRQITSSRTPSEFIERVTEAEEYLKEHRGRRDLLEDGIEGRKWRICVTWAKDDAITCATREGVSTTYVQRVRREFDKRKHANP